MDASEMSFQLVTSSKTLAAAFTGAPEPAIITGMRLQMFLLLVVDLVANQAFPSGINIDVFSFFFCFRKFVFLTFFCFRKYVLFIFSCSVTNINRRIFFFERHRFRFITICFCRDFSCINFYIFFNVRFTFKNLLFCFLTCLSTFHKEQLPGGGEGVEPGEEILAGSTGDKQTALGVQQGQDVVQMLDQHSAYLNGVGRPTSVTVTVAFPDKTRSNRITV